MVIDPQSSHRHHVQENHKNILINSGAMASLRLVSPGVVTDVVTLLASKSYDLFQSSSSSKVLTFQSSLTLSVSPSDRLPSVLVNSAAKIDFHPPAGWCHPGRGCPPPPLPLSVSSPSDATALGATSEKSTNSTTKKLTPSAKNSNPIRYVHNVHNFIPPGCVVTLRIAMVCEMTDRSLTRNKQYSSFSRNLLDFVGVLNICHTSPAIESSESPQEVELLKIPVFRLLSCVDELL